MLNFASNIKQYLKNSLSEYQRARLKKSVAPIFGLLFGYDLTRLALALGTDKAGQHYYTQHYERHFKPLRWKRLNILEIGIGGYESPIRGGESLRLWKYYFPNSRVFGIDIYDKSFHNEHRIKTFQGSQVDEEFLNSVISEIGSVDIIIDDGSHLNKHVIRTFELLFPKLSQNGIYVVEDLQTSYWEGEVAGNEWDGSKDLNAPHTSMNFFKRLVDCLNYEEFIFDDYQPSYYEKNIISMHFYHNLLFIYKGSNNEGSNILGKKF